jgi:hypothetical protein
MATRATYQFIKFDDNESVSVTVYKHHDGYPEGAVRWLTNTVVDLVCHGEVVSDNLRYSIHPKTLAHAFMRANKKHGFMEITPSYTDHADTEYHYVITPHFCVLIFGKSDGEKHPNKLLFEGTLAKANEWAYNP